MKELLRQAEELIQRIHRLLDRNDKLSADLMEKDEKIRELHQQLKEKTERIRLLEEGAASTKLAESVHLPEEEIKEMKKKINEYLRELDRCIAKLGAEG